MTVNHNSMSEEVFNARFGLDGDELERIAQEYEGDSFPDGSHANYRPGRPRLYDEQMTRPTRQSPRPAPTHPK